MAAGRAQRCGGQGAESSSPFLYNFSKLILKCNLDVSLMRPTPERHIFARATFPTKIALPLAPGIGSRSALKTLVPTAVYAADALVIDATNVLCAAAADRKRWAHAAAPPLPAAFSNWLTLLTAASQAQLIVGVFDNPETGQGWRSGADPRYLQRRRRRRQAAGSSAPPGKDSQGQGKLAAFLQEFQRRGGVGLVAGSGLEADDVIAATSTYLQGLDGRLSVAIASADADMKQMLGPRAFWLQLLQTPAREAPAGLAGVSAADFARVHGFPPAAYAAWLALVGKKEAGIGGVGVGAGPAAKLVARYGSIEAAAEAAVSGQLKGWAPAIQAALQPGSSAHQRLMHNLQMLTASADAGALSLEQRRQIDAAVAQLDLTRAGQQQRERPQSEALAWLHPFQAWRWRAAERRVAALAEALRRAGAECSVKATTPEGLAVDILVQAPGAAAPTPVFLCCDLDFSAAVPESDRLQLAAPLAQWVLEAAAQGSGGGVKLSALNGTMRAYVQQVRRCRVGRPVCVPWWHVDAADGL